MESRRIRARAERSCARRWDVPQHELRRDLRPHGGMVWQFGAAETRCGKRRTCARAWDRTPDSRRRIYAPPAKRPAYSRLDTTSLQHDFGIPVNWLEEQSRTTLENAEYSARILLPTGHSRIVLVTDAWHMQRSRWSFEQAGFTVLPAPQGFYSTRQNLPLS